MKIEELRIGNIVRNKAAKFIIVESIISRDCILCSGEENKTKQTWEKYSESEIFPIDISDGILINRFGFIEEHDEDTGHYIIETYMKHTGKYHISLLTDDHHGAFVANGSEWCLHIDNQNYDSVGSADIKYLHQVQNIVFDVTGENIFKL